VDLCGPFATTSNNNTYVMVCVEHFSKTIVLVPIPSKDADVTAYHFLHNVLGRFGACAEVLTDQGSEWKGAFAQLLTECLIDHRQTSANHPQGNGLSERVVQTCKRALKRMATDPRRLGEWDTHVAYVMLGYNCSAQAATGFAPYELLHGVKATIPPATKREFDPPIDFDTEEAAAESLWHRGKVMRRALAEAGENLLIAQHRNTLRYAFIRGGAYHPRLRRFEVGDYAYYRPTTTHAALDVPTALVILRVIEVRASGVIVLEGQCGTTFRAHVTNLAPCHLPILDEAVDPRLARPSIHLPCEVCKSPRDPAVMLLCDACNSGWHTHCLKPALDVIPEGSWICPNCTTKGITAPPLNATTLPVPLPPRTVVPKPKAPSYLLALDGAKVQRSAADGRAIIHGVSSYVGQRSRKHTFELVWDDQSVETCNAERVRALLIPSPKRAAPRQAAATWGSEGNEGGVLSGAAQREGFSHSAEGFVRGLKEAVMPGVHQTSHFAAACRVLRKGGDLCRIPASCLSRLDEAIRVELCGALYAPWGGVPEVASLFESYGFSTRTGLGDSHIAGLYPGWYNKGCVSPSAVLVNAPVELLDMALPSAAAAVPIVLALVPWEYVSEADGPRLGWFQSMWEESRLRFVRNHGLIWVIVCSSAHLMHTITASLVYDMPYVPV
jgi:hypothetical protein